MHNAKRIGILAVVAVFAQCVALACEYNVRDVGFVDLKTTPYKLYVYVDGETSAATREMLDDALFMGLLDSNIEARVVDVGTDEVVPGKHLLKDTPLDTFPSAILESPKGYTQVVSLKDAVAQGADSVEAALAGLMHSPMRETLLSKVTTYYGVVLLIEGPDAAENEAVQDAATRSVRLIHTRMKMLPKAIANPPIVETITREQYAEESLLLWSFGIDPATVDAAHAVILYGRGRQMGPVLKGEAITEERLSSYLQVIGADCECGLDRSWMQGTMIPLQWGDEIQEKVSTSLGFDPENPRTKMEISMTVAKGERNRLNSGSDTKNPDAQADAGSVSFAYSEDAVTFETSDESILDTDTLEIATLDPSLMDGTESRTTLDGDVIVDDIVLSEEFYAISWSELFIFGGAALLIVVVAGAIVLQSMSRDN